MKDPDNTHIAKALTLKADALYNMGDFEHALLNYYRALKNANSRVSLNKTFNLSQPYKQRKSWHAND